MRTRAESLFLWGACIAIAGAGALGLRRTARLPAVDPRIEAEEARFREEAKRPRVPLPADRSLERFKKSLEWTAEARSEPRMNWAASIFPELVPHVVDPPILDQRVLPAILETTSAADLDGVALTWKLGKVDATLSPWRKRVDAGPSGFRIYRREAGQEWELAAELGAKSVSWRDAGAPAGRVLEYRVELQGPEDAIRPWSREETSVRTPRDRRVTVLLLATDAATVRVDTYNREERKWLGRTVHVFPGRELWPGGWRLNGVALRGPSLEAEFARPEGGTTVLRTGQQD